jgi:hypothetical protein
MLVLQNGLRFVVQFGCVCDSGSGYLETLLQSLKMIEKATADTEL